MADVIHRTTLELRMSVNTSEFDSGTWIINPNLSGVSGVAKKYWKISGDSVLEMDQTEKDAVDAAETAAQESSTKAVRKVDGRPVFILDDDFLLQTYRLGGKIPIERSLYSDDVVIKVIAHTYVDTGDTGTIRVYDATNAQEMGTISVTEDVETLKSVELTNIPADDFVIEIHGKVSAPAEKMYLEAATVEIYR